MRHSDPKLTAKVYTHVLVDTKAEAIDMLPTVAATSSAKSSTKSADKPGDSCGSDFNRQITTYSDAEKAGKQVFSAMPKNKKASVSQRKTGAGMYGAPETFQYFMQVIKTKQLSKYKQSQYPYKYP